MIPTITTTKTKTKSWPRPRLIPTSASTWPRPSPSLAYINWLVWPIYTIFYLFYDLIPSVIMHTSSVALVCQSSTGICTSIIMLRFIIRTYTLFFLGQLVRITYTRTHNCSRLGSTYSIISSLTRFPLLALVLPISFQRTVRSYTLSRTNFILQIFIHAFLNNYCIIQYTSCGFDW